MPEYDDGVQPHEGQGAAGDAPYAEYLNRIPEEVRGQVEPVFKEWDANTTRRFQEQAEYRKQWEPYEQLGVQNLSQDQVQWAMQFMSALDSPQTIKDWYQTYAQANGLSEAEKQQQAQQAQQAQPDLASYDQFGGYEDPAQIQNLLKEQLGPLQQELQALAAWRQQQDQQKQLQEAERLIESQKSDLRTKHPEEYNEEAISKLVAQYVSTDPLNAVPRAFADWQQIRGDIEKATLQSKVNQPPPPESGGVADGSPERITSLAQANVIALARLRGQV